MQEGLHYRKRKQYPHPNKLRRRYDKFIYVIVVLGPLANMAQLLKIWMQKNAEGVSLLAWTTYLFIAASWFVYGMLHKEKPIMITNFFFLITQIIIVIGILLYG